MRLSLVGSIVGLTFAISNAAYAQETPPPVPPPPPANVEPPPPVPPPPPPPPPPHWGPGPQFHGPPPMRTPPTRVPVTVESTNPEKNVVVERRVKVDEMYGRTLFVVPQHSEVQTWEQVCVAPCKVDLDRSASYRIGQENSVTRSGKFTLPPGTDQVKLDVQPGNFWWHAVGTRLIAAGTVAAIVGGAFITTALTWDDKSDEKHVRTAGIITGAIGLALLAAGIPIAILTQTHVKANDRKLAAGPKLTLGGLTF